MHRNEEDPEYADNYLGDMSFYMKGAGFEFVPEHEDLAKSDDMLQGELYEKEAVAILFSKYIKDVGVMASAFICGFRGCGSHKAIGQSYSEFWNEPAPQDVEEAQEMAYHAHLMENAFNSQNNGVEIPQ